MSMTPEAKRELSSTIRSLRARLLSDLHDATESAYRLSVHEREAGLSEAALKRAEDEANERLDGILSEGERPLIVKVDLGLRNREVGTEAEVESLVSNIRERLLEQVRAGQRVRIV